jgi:hypothetical protein
MRRRTSFSIAVATIALALATIAPTGAEAVPAVGCGSITVNHTHYSVRAHVLNCRLARKWSVAFLAHGSVPAGYDCQRYSPKVTRVRFLCDNPSTVTRIDGPLSFSASR